MTAVVDFSYAANILRQYNESYRIREDAVVINSKDDG
jgi:hypothetical protein